VATTPSSVGIAAAGSATVVNSGAILSTFVNQANLSSVAGYGISIGGSGTVVNSGTIAAVITGNGSQAAGYAGAGIALYGGGSVTNSAGGTVIGQAAIGADGPASVVNSGLLKGGTSGYGFGVFFNAGGSLYNTGVEGNIVAYDAAVVFDGLGSIDNTAAIHGVGSNGIGIYLGASGITLTNTGVIGGHYGILAGAGGMSGDTIINDGIVQGGIDGGTGPAIALGSGSDLLILGPGAKFDGNVVGGGGDAIELAAGSGELEGLGSQIAGFAMVRVDAGASWIINGSGPDFVNDGTIDVAFSALSLGTVTHDKDQHGVIFLSPSDTVQFAGAVASGETLTFTDAGTALLDRPLRFKATIADFQAGEAIDLVGEQADEVDYAGHRLVVTENGNAVASLHFAGQYETAEFALSSDGHGGTDITSIVPAAADLWTMRG
jgi:hypothetical protein